MGGRKGKVTPDSVYGWLKSSVWTFPLVLFIIVAGLSVLRISGTSVGVYHEFLYGNESRDDNLLYGHPQPIRSDEWLGGTQILISQSKNDFPKVNRDLSGQQEVSLQTDAPTKDWPVIFKPQLWSFLVLPLENAFAFKWWILMYLLIISCYFFTLRFINDRLFAALFGVALGISPFELWWYQSGAFLSLAYGFLILILFMRVMNREKIRFIESPVITNFLYGAGLVFLLTCFGLIFYPPFQIPVAVVMLFFALGYLAHKKFTEKEAWLSIAKKVGLLAVGVVIAGLIGAGFIFTHHAPVEALNNSLYPGHRVTVSGGMKTLQFFDSFVMPAEQSAWRASHFFTNQSEAANFILLFPFLLLPGFVLIIRDWLKAKKIDWVFLSLQVCGLLLLARAFMPYGGPLYKLLLLNRVPNNGRLLIGFGFLGVLQLVFLVKKINESGIRKKKLLAIVTAYGMACLLFLVYTGNHIRTNYPMFLHNWIMIFGLAIFFVSIIVAFLAGMKRMGVLLLLVFTLACSFKILPLYRGLGPLTHSAVITKMQAVSDPDDTWVTVGQDARVYENFGIVAGRRSLSGAQIYPRLKVWEQVAGPSYENVYNRQGHISFEDGPSQAAPLSLIRTNAFSVKFQCDSFIQNNAQFALSVHPLSQTCLKLESTVSYPKVTFYLYKITS